MKKLVVMLIYMMCCTFVMAQSITKPMSQKDRTTLFLFLPDYELRQDKDVTVTLVNSVNASTYVDIIAYNEAGLTLTTDPIPYFIAGSVNIPEEDLPVGTSLIAVVSDFKLVGYVSIQKEGNVFSKIDGFDSGTREYKLSVSNICNTSLIIINPNSSAIDLEILTTGKDAPRESGILTLSPMENLYVDLENELIGVSAKHTKLKLKATDQFVLLKSVRQREGGYNGVTGPGLPQPLIYRITSGPPEDEKIRFTEPADIVKIYDKCHIGGVCAREYDDEFHSGTDYMSDAGNGTATNTPAFAVNYGMLTNNIGITGSGGMGNTIVLEHVLTTGVKWLSLYAHLDSKRFADGLIDIPIAKKQKIGIIGCSKGNTTSWCDDDGSNRHIHFEIKPPDLGSNDLMPFGYLRQNEANAYKTQFNLDETLTLEGVLNELFTTVSDLREQNSRILLPYFSMTAEIPTSEGYDVYGIADELLYASVHLQPTEETTFHHVGVGGVIFGTKNYLDPFKHDDFTLNTNSAPLIATGAEAIKNTFAEGEYSFYAYSDEFGRGYELKFSIIPEYAEIIDNDQKRCDLSCVTEVYNAGYYAASENETENVSGYYLSAKLFHGNSHHWARWFPANRQLYKVYIHIAPGATAQDVRYVVYPRGKNPENTCSSTDPNYPCYASDPVNHAENQGAWVQLTTANGATDTFCFDYTTERSGYVGLYAGGDEGDNGNPNASICVDAVKFVSPLPAPSNLIATPISLSQINLSWEDNSTNEMLFRIEQKVGSDGEWRQVGEANSNATSFRCERLEAETTYFYRVRAYNNEFGNSAFSDEAPATTNNSNLPAPSDLTASAVSSSQINLSWTGNLSWADSSLNATGFRVERKDGANGTWSQIKRVSANETTFFNKGLEANTTYCFRVKAYYNSMESGYSNEDSATTTTGDDTLAAPSNLTAIAVSPSQINLSWTDNSSNETGFRVERKVGANGTWSQIRVVGANGTTLANKGLKANTTYYFRVKAFYQSKESGYSNEVSATTTTDDGNLAAPSNLTATVFSQSQIDLSWTDNSSNETAFRIESKIGPNGTWEQIRSVRTNITSVSIKDLRADTTYYFRVKAFYRSISSGYSNEVFATTGGGGGNGLEPPSNLTASRISSIQIDLSWQDNSSTENGFTIERKIEANGTWARLLAVGANVTAYSDTGLSINTTYYYRVKSYNTSGNSGYSNTDSAKTIVTYTSNPSPGNYTSVGNVLKMKVAINGSEITFTVAKQDGSNFTSDGVMTIRAGAYYGCVANYDKYFWDYKSGTATISAKFDLYFTSGTKEFYAAVGRPEIYCDGYPPTYYSGELTVTAH